MSSNWEWHANQIANIVSWKTSSLSDLHFLLYKDYVNQNLVKRRLHRFPGLVFKNKEEQNQHLQAITKEISTAGFQRI